MIFQLFFVLLFCVSSIGAQTILDTHLKDGLGVRGMTMGNAFTALGEGPGGAYYNPAGVALKGSQYSYENYDVQHANTKSFQAFHLYRSPIAYSNSSRKNLNDDAINLNAFTFARAGKKGLDWGITYKSVSSKVDDVTSTGWSSDLGLLLRLFPFMNVGVTGRDLFKKNVAVPTTYTAGLALFSPKRNLIFTSDLVYSEYNKKGEYNGHYGAEYHVSSGLVLRGGWYNERYTGSVNVVFPYLEFEYGVIRPANSSEEPQHVLSAKFGRGVDAYKRRRRYSLFKRDSFAKFAIGGSLIPGKSEVSLFGGYKIGTNDLLPLIHEAGQDKQCEGFIIRIGQLSSGLSGVGLIQEIRNELVRAKAKGKKVVVYLDGWATLNEYYLASVADKIMLPELGSISHLGLKVHVKKTKRMLENFGLQPMTITSGAQKASLSPTTAGLSAYQRSQVENLVSELYHQVVSDIRNSRNLDWEKVSTLFDGRLISAREAKAHGLVDELGYWRDINGAAAPSGNMTVNTHSLADYGPATQHKSLMGAFNRIVVMEVDGVITMGNNRSNILFGGKSTGARDIERVVNAIRRDFTVKGVILRVNSPGGSVLASDQIYTAIKRLKSAGKLVYVSMGNIAASGGYYVSMPADKIIANPGTLTGSIGVVSAFLNREELDRFLGIDHETIKTGKHMDAYATYKGMTDEEKALYQRHQDRFYYEFVDLVVDERNLTRSEVFDVAQGQVFTGNQAKRLKIIDEVGGLYDVVEEMSKELDIDYPEITYVRPRSRFSLPGIGGGGFLKYFGKLSELRSKTNNPDLIL